MKSDDELISQFKKHKGSSDKGLSKQMVNVRDCQAFYAGDFMSYTDRLQFADGRGNKKSTLIQFNKVKPYVNAVRGFMAQNRKNADYVARHENDKAQEFYSTYSNALKSFVRDNANADQIETQQDGDLLICGYGAVETAMTYGEGFSTDTPNGQILIGRLDPRSVGWDPSARATNLLDARYVHYKKIYSMDEALELFDDSKPADFQDEMQPDSGNKVYYKRGGTYNKIQELYDWEVEDEHLIKVYFYQWYDIERFYRAKNPLSAIQDPQELLFARLEMESIAAEQEFPDDPYALNPNDTIISCDKDTKKKLEAFFDQEITFEEYKRKVYYTAVLSGRKVFTKYRSVCQNGFTIKFKTGDYDESNKMWTGMVNSLRDPALYYNKALTELLYTIASQAKGGVMVERSAVEDVENFEAKWSRTDGAIVVEDGALSGNKIRAKKEGYQATGIEEVLTEANNALPDVAGIDKTFLGSSENKQETGQLQRQRIRQVTTTLATYFDSITLYSKEHAKLLLPLMRILAENNNGAMFNAIGKDGGMEWMTMSEENFVDEYDIMIQELPDSVAQQNETAQFIGQIVQMLPAGSPMQMQALAIMVKNSPIDFLDRQTIMQAILPQDPHIDPHYVQQLEAQIKQLMDEGNKAKVAKLISESHLNMMRGEDIISKIKKDAAEIKRTKSQAEQSDIENQILLSRPKHEDVNVNA